ncbi:Protein F54H5.3 [Aphelenchoides avenae]|nr:Protein F54H5.3 [Aphelenchus avenae]
MDPAQNAPRDAPGGLGAPPTAAAPFILDLQQKGSETTSSTAAARPSPKFIRVEPLPIALEPSGPNGAKGHVQITNVSAQRIAWRIRSNAPTRYVVNPACGFLTSMETIRVNIELLDVNKYNTRHKFMAQAMVAKNVEKDRRKVWETERAQNISDHHFVRIATSKPGQQKPPSPARTSVTSASVSSASGSLSTETSVTSSGSSAMSSLSESSARCLPSLSSAAVTTAVSADLSEEEIQKKIVESSQRVKAAIVEKEKAISLLAEAINDVKRIEVDLDRTGNEVMVLTGRLDELNVQCAMMKQRSAALDEQVKRILKPF